MSKALAEYSPERWSAALRVLRGEDPTGVSWSAAAAAAGVPVGVLRGWVRRAELRDPSDDPAIWAIADDVRDLSARKAGRLEDRAWSRAMSGSEVTVERVGPDGSVTVTTTRKDEPGVMMRLLERYDESYRSSGGPTVQIEVGEIYRRLLAERRIAQAGEEARDVTPGVRSLGAPAEPVEVDL